jgi:hypothetical protein
MSQFLTLRYLVMFLEPVSSSSFLILSDESSFFFPSSVSYFPPYPLVSVSWTHNIDIFVLLTCHNLVLSRNATEKKN